MALVGLVVVSHSRPLADAAVDLALEMVHGERPPIVVAAGMPDGSFGTDATAVLSAIEEAEAGAGVVVIVDLGSAVMSAEMAVEFVGAGADDVRVVPAPFVEGLMAATVLAASGARLDEVAREAAGALRAKLSALGSDEDEHPTPSLPESAAEPHWGAEAFQESVLPNAAGLHARPAAMLAAEVAKFDADVRVVHVRGAVAARSPIALATISARYGESLRIEARGPQAREAVAAVAALVSDGFGEPAPSNGNRMNGNLRTLGALGVSPGRVVGPVARMFSLEAPEVVSIGVHQIETHARRIKNALKAVAEEYLAQAEAADPEAASILRATAAIAQDPTLRDAARHALGKQRVAAPNALWIAGREVAAVLAAAGGRLAERATDILDVRDRAVAHLLDVPPPGIPEPGHPFILVARDLAPADTARLDAKTCLGIVTAEGGPTSHTAILARGLGIPAVIGAARALEIPDDTVLLVDGDTGELVVGPTEEQQRGARTGPEPLVSLSGPGHTADGVHVALLANVGSGEDAHTASEAGAEGVGLFRTEFCFLGRAEEPGVEEQVKRYSQVLAEFDSNRVVFRTLDAGSDKPMPFLGIDGELNPALGLRGYRTNSEHPGVLERQLEAIVTAASTTPGSDVWVMAPMISTPQEAEEFAALARAAGVAKVGAMVETPSAALQTREILDVVDFISVGTNDLTQYTMAADRQVTGLGGLQDAWQPGVLRLLEIVGRSAAEAGKPAGICGEAASDPLLAPVLVGLGISSLSAGPRQLNTVARSLASVTFEQCRQAAHVACSAPSAAAAKEAVRRILGGGTAG